MTDRPDKRPPSLLVAVGPALTALAMVFNLVNPRTRDWVWVPISILIASLALVAFVLVQRRRATRRNR